MPSFRDPLRLHIGQKLGSYELLTPAAENGTGRVWVARLRGARGFHKLVALKALRPFAGDVAHEQKLLGEARLAAEIQHSNVVQLLELGEHAGLLYLVSEWVDGESLSAVVEGARQVGGVPVPIAVNWIAQLLRGLQAAHELRDEAGERLGVVHGELSPHRVLISHSGTVKLLDVGISQSARATDRALAYRAPEQISSSTVDQRSDLFAVGVMLYELTTGRHPFEAESSAATARHIESDEPAVRPSLSLPNYSRTLEAVLMKALDKNRDRRWPSAEEMRLALQRGVPEPFELGFEARLRTFMSDTVGERARRKRDVLRRAEIVVDAGGSDSSLGPSSSQSSLRGLTIDTTSSGRAVPVPRRAARLPSLRPLLASVPPAALRRSSLIALVALAALILAAFWWRAPGVTSHSATSPTAGMVDLTPPRDAASSKRVAQPSSASSAIRTAPSASAVEQR